MARKPTYEELKQRVKELEKKTTRLKRAEEALRKSEEKFDTIIENTKEGIVIIQDDRTVYVNPRVEQLSPFSREEIFSEDFPYFIHPEDRTTMIQRYLQVKRGKKFSEYHDYRVLDKEGNIRWVTVNSTSTNYRGKPAVLVFLTEITQRKQREEALRESEETARAILNAAPDSALLVDVEGTVLDINEVAAQRLRTNVEDIKGKCIYDFLAPELVESRKARVDEVISTGDPVRFEDTHSGRYIDSNIYPVLDQHGSVTRLAIFDSDITDRRRFEEALRESEEKYRTILKNIEEGYYEVDTAGNFTFFNDSMCKVLGYSKDELLGMNNRQVMDQDNSKKVYQTFNKVFITGAPDKATDWEIIRKDGGKRYIEASVSLMKDREGLPMGFRGIARDITKIKLPRRQEKKRKRALL